MNPWRALTCLCVDCDSLRGREMGHCRRWAESMSTTCRRMVHPFLAPAPHATPQRGFILRVTSKVQREKFKTRQEIIDFAKYLRIIQAPPSLQIFLFEQRGNQYPPHSLVTCRHYDPPDTSPPSGSGSTGAITFICVSQVLTVTRGVHEAVSK